MGIGLLAACDHSEVFGVELWPAQRAILEAIDAGPRIHALCLGRRSGKTFMAALVMLHNCLLRPDLRSMVRPGECRYATAVATNLRQARLLVAAARSIVESSPTLARMVASATEDEIRFTNRTALAAFPCSSRGGRGWAVSCLVMDEAAFFYSETDGPQAADEVWRALSPSLAQFGDAGRIIVASTPNGPSGFFYDLYTRAQAGSLPEARAHHAATSEVNPAIAAAFLASEAARDPDGYRGEFEAEFVAGGGSFFDVRELELADGPARPEDARRWIAGADPAFSRDQWGLAVVGESVSEPDTLIVGTLAGIEPGGRLRSFGQRRAREDATLAQVWGLLEPYAERGLRMVSDQHQSDAVSSYFGRLGVGVKMVNLTGPLQTGAFTSTRARLTDGSLRLWRHEPTLAEMRRVRAGKNSESIVLPRHGSSHCDVISALCLAVAEFKHRSGGRLLVPQGRAGVRSVARAAPGSSAPPEVTPGGNPMPVRPMPRPPGIPDWQWRITRKVRGR